MRDYVLTLLVTAAVTYMLTPLVRRLAGRVGAMKQPRERDVHVVPVATLGGLAMYGGLAAGLLVADRIPLLREGFADTGMVSGLLLAGGLLVVIGFIDDRWGMGALPKAAGQVAAGGILVATGTSLSWLPLPGGETYIPTTNEATLLTILVVVATINAVNFIDGLDGLAAGIVAIAAISFFLYYYSLTKVISISSLAAPALASAILIGMCLGFLPHNFSPARIFMGDTGSMLLGLLLAYAPISSITWTPEPNLTSQINRYPVVLPLLLPAALLVIPYGDLLLAVVRRTRAGRSPFAPDRKHLHHRLLDIGHSQRASVLIMYLWAAVFSGLVVFLSIERTVQPGNAHHHGEPILVLVLITVAAVAALLLMSMPRLRWWQRPRLGTEPGGLPAGQSAAVTAGLESAASAAAGVQPGIAEPGLAGITAAGLMPALSGEAAIADLSVRAPSVFAEPVLAEPVRAEPVRAEPVRAEPVRGEAGWPEPARTPSVPAESGWPEPARYDSGRREPARYDAARTELAGTEPRILAETAWGNGITAERLPAGSRRLRPGPVEAAGHGFGSAEAAQSLAFWRQEGSAGLPSESRRASPAFPDEPLPDYESAAPSRSVIGVIPPAVTGQAPAPPAPSVSPPPSVSPAPPASQRAPASSAHADAGSMPAADGTSPDR